MAKSIAEKPAARGGGLALKLGLLALGGAALSALPLCLLALPGMMPAFAVFCIDKRRPRYLSYVVAVMNFAGVAPFLLVVAKDGMSLLAAAQKLSDPFTWLVMYGAAAGGWLLSAATPTLARFCIEVQEAQRRRALEALAKAIKEEWGGEVAGESRKG